MRYTSGCVQIHQMWDIERKTARDKCFRKRTSTGFIYVPGSKLCEAEGNLNMRSCLKDAVINSDLRIG